MIDVLLFSGISLFFLIQLDQVSLRNKVILTNYAMAWIIISCLYLITIIINNLANLMIK
jgi:hypothetical protein